MTPTLIHNDFTASDICRIIKASQGTGIKEIVAGSLRISFHIPGSRDEEDEIKPQALAGQPREPEKVTGDIIPENDLNEVIEEIAQENFMIQDPAAYERELLDERIYQAEDHEGEPGGQGSEVRRS